MLTLVAASLSTRKECLTSERSRRPASWGDPLRRPALCRRQELRPKSSWTATEEWKLRTSPVQWRGMRNLHHRGIRLFRRCWKGLRTSPGSMRRQWRSMRGSRTSRTYFPSAAPWTDAPTFGESLAFDRSWGTWVSRTLWLTAKVETWSARQMMNTVLFMMVGLNGSSSSSGVSSTLSFTFPSLRMQTHQN